MAEGTPGSEVEQEVLHGAGADIPRRLWKRPLFSEVTAAASPPPLPKPRHVHPIYPVPEEKKGRGLPQSAVDTWYC